MDLSIFAEHEWLHLMGDYTEIILGIVAILGVGLGFYRWNVKKVTEEIGEDQQLKDIIEGQNKLVTGIEETQKQIKASNTKLETHMDEELEVREEEYNLIQESIDENKVQHDKIFDKIEIVMATQNKSAHRQVENTLSMVRGLYRLDPEPVLIYKTDPENWRAIWCNIAWTEWTGLSLEETRAGGDLLAIKHDSEREVIEPAVTQTGRAKEEMNFEYVLQNPSTEKVIGRVSAHAEVIDPYNDQYWYYIARIALLDE